MVTRCVRRLLLVVALVSLLVLSSFSSGTSLHAADERPKLPRLRGTQVFAHHDWTDTHSSRWQNVLTLKNSKANAVRLFLEEFDSATGSPILPGEPLADRVLAFLDEWGGLVDWCLANDLAVIVSIDTYFSYPVDRQWPDDGRSLWKDDSAQDELIDAWGALTTRFSGRPNVFFDVLNEPHGTLPDEVLRNHALPKAVWNRLSPRIVDRIRAIDANRSIIIEPIWGDPKNFADLMPIKDAGVLYSFHYY